jgi:beta-lactamase superfamily II metal-dependent hydrolase
LRAVAEVVALVTAAWGDELFSPNDTTAENEMSVVQCARLCERDIVLTGDAGRSALAEAADYAPVAGLSLPGVDRIQLPHHGSRRNVSTEILDRWLGPRLTSQSATSTFTAIISAAKEDSHHPRNAVVRAAIHRGGEVHKTKGHALCTSKHAPERGWTASVPLPYPAEQEDAGAAS